MANMRAWKFCKILQQLPWVQRVRGWEWVAVQGVWASAMTHTTYTLFGMGLQVRWMCMVSKST